MKKFWLKDEECTGCGMCADVCPVHAIEMKSNQCGFLYPQINNNCIDCNLCEKKCTHKNIKRQNENSTPVAYAAWTKDEDLRYNSTSGGIFSEIAKNVINKGGVVAGAAYNGVNLVEHIIISSEDELYKIRQSKYIQSDTNHIYLTIKELLDEGVYVSFCGTPCQVGSLYSFLDEKKYDNLLTIDFICRGVNSPKAYKSWLKEIEKKQNNKVTRVWFKYKENGWKKSPKCTRVDFENGECLVLNQNENLFMCGYLNDNLYIRPSCGDCKYKGIPRLSDITLADFWGIDPKLDDDKGVSLVLVNNEKGKNGFNDILNKVIFEERDFDEIEKGNICFDNSVLVPQKSEQFLKSLDNIDFSMALSKYSYKENIVKRIGKRVKHSMKKVCKL